MDSRIRKAVSKGTKYRFPSYIYFDKCREEIASALNDFGNRWCKREGVEDNALQELNRKVQLGNDQETAQPERSSYSKNRGVEKNLN